VENPGASVSEVALAGMVVLFLALAAAWLVFDPPNLANWIAEL
jgi:hypothetical protein